MKCPLQSAKVLGDSGDIFVLGKCLGRDCAWWSHQYARCAIWTLAEVTELPPRPLTTAFIRKVLELVKDGKITEAILELGAAIDVRSR